MRGGETMLNETTYLYIKSPLGDWVYGWMYGPHVSYMCNVNDPELIDLLDETGEDVVTEGGTV